MPPDDEIPDPSPADDAAPLLALRDGLPPVVESPAQLAAAVDRLAAGTGPLAIDAERASGYRYSQRAYLIQLRREGSGTVLIDPAPFGDVPNDSMRDLAEAVADEEWVIHAASQDLPCLAEVGLRPRKLFDTELAGRLLNYPRVGLAVLVEELAGFSMRKEHSAVDWSRRPLPESWLLYAALDVELLVELRGLLDRQLRATGKSEWARQEFAAWAESGPPVRRVDPWRRTSGIHRARGRRGLAIVRELWELRDRLAQVQDIAPGRIVRDQAIVEAAQVGPRSRGELARLAGFSGRGVRRHLAEFADAVQRAQELPDADLPTLAARHDGPPPPRVWANKNPAAADRLRACRDTVNALAETLDLPAENLLEPDALRRLAWSPPAGGPSVPDVAEALRSGRAREWQIELTAAALAATLRA